MASVWLRCYSALLVEDTGFGGRLIFIFILFYFLLFYFNTMEEVHKLKFLSGVCSSEFCYFYLTFSYCILLSNCNLIGMVFYFFKFHLIICLVM